MKIKALAALIAVFVLFAFLIPAPAAAFSLGLEPVSGIVGSEVKIPAFCQYGEGDYYLYWGDDNQLIEQGTVDSKGCTPIYFKVPEAARGTYNVTLKVGSKSFSRDFTVKSSIVLGTKTGAAGSQIEVTGYGFGNQEGGIRITYDGASIASNIAANRNGTWQYQLEVPVSCRGSHVISASEQDAATQGNIKADFNVTPTIAVNPATGWVGRVVNISGAGFGSGESSITVLYDDMPVKSALVADNTGSWQSSFSIPLSSKGMHKLDAKGNMTAAKEVPEVSFSISPGIRVEQTSGKIGEVIHVGDKLLVSGIGFQANESNIAVTFDGTQIVGGIAGDAQGSWSAQFSVPPIHNGEHTVESSGYTTLSADVTSYTVVVTPYLEINPAKGAVGTSIVLNGTGFSSNQALHITYDSKDIETNASTDYRGNMDIPFKIPVSSAGMHTVTVNDAGGASAAVKITVESTPPQAPALISPEGDTQYSILDMSPIAFTWSSVEDPSGVVYTFEMSPKPSFSGDVIHKENLEKPELSLHFNEHPLSGNYYWRVKAVDLAGNSSKWSEVQAIAFSNFDLIRIGAIVIGVIVVIILIAWRIRTISKKGGWSSDSESDS